jgi:hypothetical protein
MVIKLSSSSIHDVIHRLNSGAEAESKIWVIARIRQGLQTIYHSALIERVKAAVERLETTPVENRRPLCSNLIHFAELHPTKIRVGIAAPAQMKATGTDGTPSTRAGSTSVTIGAPGRT